MLGPFIEGLVMSLAADPDDKLITIPVYNVTIATSTLLASRFGVMNKRLLYQRRTNYHILSLIVISLFQGRKKWHQNSSCSQLLLSF
ncbi:hypothetical protein BDR04DRAFT_1104103 [Suillus decipiens]|nr:hypothetical protein BDR04DRAFT_1104103 [Suillus decipiens]